MRVAVVGVGSIGARHVANLQRLGAYVVTVDSVLPADHKSFDQVPDVDAVVIATPTESHVQLALEALARGCDVFVEKPLAANVSDALALQPALLEGRVFQVGYNLRFRPELRELRGQMQVDRPVLVRMEFAQRLTEWRPGRNYLETPTAKPHRDGGGVLLEASHELDLMLWMFGPWAGCIGAMRTLSGLAPTVDYAGAIVDYGDLLVELSLDMITSGYRRFIRAVHVDGAVTEWDYSDDEGMSLLSEMAHFLQCIEYRREPEVGLTEALDVLYLVDAIAASTERGKSLRAIDTAIREPIWHRKLVVN